MKYSENSFGIDDKIKCNPSTTYTASYYNAECSGRPTLYVSYYDSNGSFIERSPTIYTIDGAATFTTLSTAYYIHVYFYHRGGFTFEDDAAIQVEKGTSKTAYTPLHIQPLKEYVTPEMFGGIGDGVTDDTVAIQSAIDSGSSIVLLTKKYLTTDTINISRSIYFLNYGSIKYTGENSAIKVEKVSLCNLSLGTINAKNGTGLELYASTYSSESAEARNRVQYVNIDLKLISALDKCIYLNLDVESGLDSSGIGWINEIRISNGKFSAGEYGIYADAKGYQKINNVKMYNVGIEGVSTGIYMANACYHWSFNNLRYAESFDTLIKTVGLVSDFAFYGAQQINFSKKLDFSAETSGVIRVPIVKNGILVSGETLVNNGVIRGLYDTVTALAIQEMVSCLAGSASRIDDGAKNIPIIINTSGDFWLYGKNLCAERNVSLTKVGKRTATILCPAITGTVTLSWTLETNAPQNNLVTARLQFSDKTYQDVNGKERKLTVTVPDGLKLYSIYLYVSLNASEDVYANFTNLMLEVGETNTSFELYNAQQKEAGSSTILYCNLGVNTFVPESDAQVTYTADPKLYITKMLN